MSESRDALIERRYAKPYDEDEVSTWRRIAGKWAHDRDEEDAFAAMMVERRAFFNTPALANASNPIACGSACYVLPINDSLTRGEASITQTLMDATAVHQYGGGTGFNFSNVRSEDSLVTMTGRRASGPTSFLGGYSAWFKTVTQMGLRPAANMAIIDDTHPDALKFITCKQTEKDITNFNISLSVSDEFMECQIAYEDAGGLMPTLWDAVVTGAWRNGEPGLFFRDTVNRTRLHPEEFNCTNPCGEVPLLDYEACVLGSVNLAAHVTQDPESWRYRLDWNALSDTIFTLVRGLDNIIDLQDYPLPIIEETHKRYRKIGVGVMGYADLLCRMGLRYGSQEALDFTDRLARFIEMRTQAASEQLALERGEYPGFREGMPWRRNLCVNVIAPTGSISRLAECSFGIEPHFDVDEEGYYDSFILDSHYRDYQPYHTCPNFTPASQVTPEQHVLTQAVWQKYTDQAVSKTCNLPNSATRWDVARIFRLAWESGCKGITVLRQGSREDVVIGVTDPNCKDGTCSL